MEQLTVVLGDYPHLRPLRDGRVTSELIELAFIERYRPVSSAFDEMVREQPFDVCEMAIGAFMQGRVAGAPITLLPVVVVGGFHHDTLRRRPDDLATTPEALAGQALAVRAYSQTTGLWVRGILAGQYGLVLDELRWLVTEGSHSDAYVDPDNVTRAAQGRTAAELLRDGDAAAAILVARDQDGTEPVIADVQAAEDAWYRANGVVGVNHMVCVRDELAADEAIARELFRMLRASHELVLGPQAQRELRPGIPGAVREGAGVVTPALQLAARYAAQQDLIPQAPPIDALLAPALRDS